jgi:CxxC-x17-CxxC domain-containing protein
MQEQFLDRLLTCVDCHGEFIFTAGEQLFFFDKQFKNDPKRCKPCKSRRSGLAAAANGTGPAAAGLSRTETRTTCSECGIETTVPFKPTQGRPVLCRQCFQLKNRSATQPPITPSPVEVPMPVPLAAASMPSTPDPASLLTSLVPSVAAVAIAPVLPPSSLASPAELAYVASLETPPGTPSTGAQIAAQWIARSPAEMLAANGQPVELQAASLDAPTA